MSDKALLEKLWQSYGDKPFSKFSLHRKSDLCHDESDTALRLLQEMSESGETQNGYRIKRVASTVYKMTQAQANESDSLKGKPLIDPKESLTGHISEGLNK